MKKRSFAPNPLAINSLSMKISCYQPHLLSKHLLSNSFTINLVAITFICYPASTAIDTFAIKPQLICYQANLLLILICYQIFDFLSILIFTIFILLKIWNSSFSGKHCVGIKPAHFVASSKGINFLKDINNYLYFHFKNKAYNT